MFPVLVARFVDWIRPDIAIGAVFSLAAPVRVQFYFFSLYLTFLFLVTWLRALGTSRKKILTCTMGSAPIKWTCTASLDFFDQDR